ncbi:MAG: cobalamin biosynthesis protein CobD [Selenomonadaceae bacterium]|nr:cobalamin biosynthesis protein CobD [Selenomonadaceae bacterium]
MIIAVVAFLIDALLGDPRSKFHPVVMMGNLISLLEKILRRELDSPLLQIFKGGLLVAVIVVVAYVVGFAVELLSHAMPALAAQVFIQALVLSFMISPRTLADAAREIYWLLESENLPRAREKVGWIVGRDTANLNEAEVSRATVETVAENTVDGVISPLFYFAVGGLPLAVAYRAINTMDSMLGYKNEKYFYFGRVAARLDDIANFIPARLTGLLFVCAAIVLHLDWRNAFNMMRRDASKHPSPNGGWAEATVAGALNIRLGGTNYYFGEPHFRAYMGEPNEILEAAHILGAIRLMYTATILFLTFACVIRF